MGEAAENLPANKSKRGLPRRLFRGCAWGCLLPFAIIFTAGWIALLVINHPRLNAAHAVRVDVSLYQLNAPYTNHLGGITNTADIRRLLAVLAQSRSGMDHKCQAAGWFRIEYEDGKEMSIDFLPGHNVERYEYRYGLGVHSMRRDEFFQALRVSGIETNGFPRLDE